MFIRKLNNDGIEEFRKQLGQFRIGARKNLDTQFLTNDVTSSTFNLNIEVEFKNFVSKEHISDYLAARLNLRENRHLYYDVGLWTWLSVFYFDLVCPEKSLGVRSVKAEARYILADAKNWVRYYRHLLACSARLYCELGELAKPFLMSPIHIWGDFHEQLTAYQSIATNSALIGTAKKLYWDENAKKLKRGAGSKGPGSPRRFSDIVGQFELTYDLNAMQSKDIVELFPQNEFSKWQLL